MKNKVVEASEGDLIRCPKCKERHKLEQGKNYVTRKIQQGTLTYNCCNKKLIGAVEGRLVEQIVKQKGRRIWRLKKDIENENK